MNFSLAFGLGEVLDIARGRGLDVAAKSVVLFGDSMSAYNTDLTSTLNSFEARGYFTHLNFKSFQRYDFQIAQNEGVSGENISDLVVRLGDLDAYAADAVFFLVSDIVTTDDVADVTDDLDTIFSYILGLGADLVVVPILPRSDWGALTAPEIVDAKAGIDAVNVYMASYPGVIYVDCFDDIDDGSGEPVSGYTNDGIHLSPVGAHVVGTCVNNRLAAVYGDYAGQWDDAANLLSNEELGGTSGTGDTYSSGDLADDYRVYDQGTNGTSSWRVFSKVAAGQQIELAVPSGNGNAGLIFQHDPHTDLSVGEDYYAEVLIDVQNAENITELKFEVREEGATLSHIYHVGMEDYPGTLMPALGRGVIRTPVFTLSNDTGKALRPRIIVNGDSSGGDAAATIVIEKMRLVQL